MRACAILFRARHLICRAHDPSGLRDSGTRDAGERDTIPRNPTPNIPLNPGKSRIRIKCGPSGTAEPGRDRGEKSALTAGLDAKRAVERPRERLGCRLGLARNERPVPSREPQHEAAVLCRELGSVEHRRLPAREPLGEPEREPQRAGLGLRRPGQQPVHGAIGFGRQADL